MGTSRPSTGIATMVLWWSFRSGTRLRSCMVVRAFRKLTEAIRGDDARGLVQGYLRPIDTDEIARRLKIDAEAAARGSRDHPTADSQSMDGLEHKIVQTLEIEWTYHGTYL